MRLSEAELANAVCLHMAERRGIRPEDVRVEFVFDEDQGFSAELHVEGRDIVWIEANMAEAVSRYVLNHYGKRCYREDIVFRLEDEIVADIAV